MASYYNKSAPVAVAPTASAASAVAANNARRSLIIQNVSTSAIIYLGKDATVTAANGIKLNPGDSFEDTLSTDAWFAITNSGTGDLRYIEVTS